jgi:hypothetical protein
LKNEVFDVLFCRDVEGLLFMGPVESGDYEDRGRGDVSRDLSELLHRFAEYAHSELGAFLCCDPDEVGRSAKFQGQVINSFGGLGAIEDHHLTYPGIPAARSDFARSCLVFLALTRHVGTGGYALPTILRSPPPGSSRRGADLQPLCSWEIVPLCADPVETFPHPASVLGVFRDKEARAPRMEVMLSPQAFETALDHARIVADYIEQNPHPAQGWVDRIGFGSIAVALILSAIHDANLIHDFVDMSFNAAAGGERYLLGIRRLSHPDRRNSFEISVVVAVYPGGKLEGLVCGRLFEQRHNVQLIYEPSGIVHAEAGAEYRERPLA